MILVKYDAKGKPKNFWLRLYGYSKGRYVYPGVLSRMEGARRVSNSTLLIREGDLPVLDEFFETWKVGYEKYRVEELGIGKREGPLRWDMPLEVLDERLVGFWEDIDGLGPFIRTRNVRSAVEDVEKYGY